MPSPLKVDKKAVPVVIYTATHRIERFYHTFDNGGRLLDELNAQRRTFIPLTDDGEVVAAKFLAVSLARVMLFFPNPKVLPQKWKEGLSRSSGELPVSERGFVGSSTVPGLPVGTVSR